jgi:hypothetical protein
MIKIISVDFTNAFQVGIVCGWGGFGILVLVEVGLVMPCYWFVLLVACASALVNIFETSVERFVQRISMMSCFAMLPNGSFANRGQ